MFSKLVRPASRQLVRFASTSSSKRASGFASRSTLLKASVATVVTGITLANCFEAHANTMGEEATKAVNAVSSQLKKSRVAVSNASEQVLWNAIRKDIEQIIEDEKSLNPGVDGYTGNSGGGGDVGPMLVRLAWHCAGSYDKESGTGGTNGATMRFKPESDHGGNAGLGHARALLEPIKAKYCDLGITYADIYVFAGCVAIETMGGPTIPFRTGRTDAGGPASPEQDKRFSPDGRLPDADGRNTDPGTHLRDIFYRMGFDDQGIVALSGAHALGRCHTDRSGFWGPWTFAPTTLSNQYFTTLEQEDWFIKRTHKGAKWTGPLQYEDKTGQLMMLPTDLVLLHDRGFRSHVAAYAKDEAKFHRDFAKYFTQLLELGCDGLLSDNVIINLGSEGNGLDEATTEAVQTEVENFRATFGKKKKKGWLW